MIDETSGAITITCDGACKTTFKHTINLTGLPESLAVKTIRAGHAAARAAAVTAGWRSGPAKTLYCPDESTCPDPGRFSVPTVAEMAAQTETAIASILALAGHGQEVAA